MAWTGTCMPLLRGFRGRDAAGVPRLLVVALLPVGRTVRRRDLHRRDLVFGAVGGPVRIVGRDDVGLRVRVVEGGVDDARRHAAGDLRAQRRFAGTALQPHPVAVAHAALLGVARMDLEPVFGMPAHVLGPPRLSAGIILAEAAARGEQQREYATGALVRHAILGHDEPGLVEADTVAMHHGRALPGFLVAG